MAEWCIGCDKGHKIKGHGKLPEGCPECEARKKGKLSLNEYQKESRKTWKENYNNDFERAILGLFGEAGEVAEKVKKSYRDNEIINPQDMAKELGDVLYYIARIAEYFDYTLSEIAEMNIEKLASRQKRNKISGSGDYR
jgi:NTP pyrophosphatase (non-canonical NTP hydrolase)